jgi:hypothetical protein
VSNAATPKVDRWRSRAVRLLPPRSQTAPPGSGGHPCRIGFEQVSNSSVNRATHVSVSLMRRRTSSHPIGSSPARQVRNTKGRRKHR